MTSRYRALAATLAAALLLLDVSAPLAGSGFLKLPKSSLWNGIAEDASEEDIKAICAEMIRREQSSPIGMADASSLYLHGQLHGYTCVKVDYFKAWQLAHQSGSSFTEKATLTFIRGRAEGGNDKAKAALIKIDKALRSGQ